MNLDPVPVGIQHYAFVVAITRCARLAYYFVTVLAEAFRKGVHRIFTTGSYSKVYKADGLPVYIVLALRYAGHLHDLQTTATFERQEVRCKVLGGIMIEVACRSLEILNIEFFQSFQVVGPEGDVFYFHEPQVCFCLVHEERWLGFHN